jgi:hypothetical protein
VRESGSVLAQSETRLTIATDLAEAKTWMALKRNPFDQIATSSFVEPAPPMPSRKPTLNKPSMQVRTVRVVTIEPPKPRRPHDGAYALGEAVEAPAQWVEIVRAVDMHARAQQSSERVKVVEKGLKMRVTGREKNWVQVSDPATSSNGWIYARSHRSLFRHNNYGGGRITIVRLSEDWLTLGRNVHDGMVLV